MSEPTGQEIKDALIAAWEAIRNPVPIQAVCECGAVRTIQNHGWAFPGQRNGLYCYNGHYLPGQDMPTREAL